MKKISLIFAFIALFMFSFCCCTEKESRSNSYSGSSSGRGGSEDPTNPENPDDPDEPNLPEPTVVMTADQVNPGNIKVNYKPEDGVVYYKCGQGNSIGNTKYYTEKTINYNRLNPNTHYSFTAIAYDSLDREMSRATEIYKTLTAPYDSYLRPSSSFYPLYNASMYVENGANGYKQKILRFNGNDGVWFRIAYNCAYGETPSSYWDEGTYHISSQSSTHNYWAYYNTGTSSISNYGGGTLTIKWGGNIMNAEIKDDDGMVVLKFVGTVN